MKQEKIKPIGTNVYLERNDLEKMHTKQLIEIRHIISRHENEFGLFDDGLGEWFMYKWDDPFWMYVNVCMLNDVLKKRPHMPSGRKNRDMIKKLISKSKRKTKRNLKYKR